MRSRTLTPLVLALLSLSAPAWAEDQPPALSKPPRLVHFEEAVPPPALVARKSADVVLSIEIDAKGEVRNVDVLERAGDGFDEAALEAARKFTFEPGEYQGEPVPVRITYRYHFFLKPEPTPPSKTASASEPVPKSVPSLGTVVKTPPAGTGRRYTSTVRSSRIAEEAVEQTLSGDEVRRIPGTQGDTLKSVQNLPGVARAPFGGGLLPVWGSAPQDTRTYIDGVYVPTLYHFGGVRSTFNGELVDGLTFFPGGYGAEFGRGLGGVIQVESRLPRTDGIHGFAQVDLVDGSMMFEGPLTQDLSLTVAARRSWVDVFLPLLTSNSLQLSPVYYDYQADLHWRASAHDDVDLLFFGSDDVLHLMIQDQSAAHSPQIDSHTYYHRALARWRHRFEGGATSEAMFSLGYDVPFQFTLNQDNTPRAMDLETFSYTFREALKVPVTDWLRLDAGLDFEGNVWPIDVTLGPQGPPRDGDPFDYYGAGVGSSIKDTSHLLHSHYDLLMNNVAPYLGATLSAFDRKLTISPQLRVDVMSFSSGQSEAHDFSHSFGGVEPRLSARWQILPWLAPKLALGLYHQPPAPLDFSREFGNPNLSPETALQYVAGFDVDPMPRLHIEVEGFYKDLRGLIVRGEHAQDPPLVNDGIGRVYGAEILIRQQLGDNFFGWVSYTLSKSERRDHADSAWRAFEYDQTHILTLVASYKFKFWDGFQAGLRFRYVTGNPYTPVVGASADGSGGFNPIYGSVYSGRVGSFNQLDLRLDKSFQFDDWKLSFYLDLQNVYNRSNPEGLQYNDNYSQSRPLSGLPFLPVIGIRGEL
jgi:TonB family protein